MRADIAELLRRCVPRVEDRLYRAGGRVSAAAPVILDALPSYSTTGTYAHVHFWTPLVRGELKGDRVSSVVSARSGRSQQKVVLLTLHDGRRVVAKVFEMLHLLDFVREASSLLSLKDLDLRLFETASVLALAHCRSATEERLILCQSYVEGRPLGGFLKDLSAYPGESHGRAASYEVAQRVFCQTGAALSQLHHSGEESGNLSARSLFCDILHRDFEGALAALQCAQHDWVDRGQYQKQFEAMLSQFDHLGLRMGPAFVDPNYGNLLVPEATATGEGSGIGAVDSANSFVALADGRAGVGCPQLDVFLVTDAYLGFRSSPGYTGLYAIPYPIEADEIEGLQIAFRCGYEAAGGDAYLTEAQVRAFELVYSTWYVLWFFDEPLLAGPLHGVACAAKRRRWVSSHYWLRKLSLLLSERHF